MTKTGVALFTMNRLDEDIPQLIRHVSEAGYDGVEFVNRMHPDIAVEPVADAMAETGLEAAGVHVWLHELEDNLETLIARYERLGCDTFVIPYHPDSSFRTERRVRQLVDRLNHLAERVDTHGFDLLYHPNHWDFIPVFDHGLVGRLPSLRPSDHLFPSTDPIRTADEHQQGDGVVRSVRKVERAISNKRDKALDRWFVQSGAVSNNTVDHLLENTPMKYILGETDPDIFGLQLDASFLQQQGFDPAAVIDRLADRIKTIHIKDLQPDDYDIGGWPSFVDPGEGEVDFERVADAARRNELEWLMVENGHSNNPLETIAAGMEKVGPQTVARPDSGPSESTG
jgi:sugar phosphate isomerase/epimerase